MTAYETEEKLDILNYVVNNLNTNISYLETISLQDSRYNLYIAQLIEMCRNLDDEVIDLETQLEKMSKEEFKEASIERLKRNEKYIEINS